MRNKAMYKFRLSHSLIYKRYLIFAVLYICLELIAPEGSLVQLNFLILKAPNIISDGTIKRRIRKMMFVKRTRANHSTNSDQYLSFISWVKNAKHYKLISMWVSGFRHEQRIGKGGKKKNHKYIKK